MRALLVSANRERLPQPVVPLGVLSVAGALREAHDVRVLDLCFEDDPSEALKAAIAAFSPEVVGVGIRNLHTNAYDGTEGLVDEYAGLARVIRDGTRAPLIVGGSGFSLRPTALMERLGAAHGVVGEGERTLRAMVDALARGETPERIVSGAAVATTTVRLGLAPRGDLDALPPVARDLVDPRYFAHDGTEPIQTKRGCAFTCAYCDYPDLEGRKVRVRDAEAVADDVVAAAARGARHVFFVDSVFNVPRSHALAICDALVRRGVPLPWVCYASPVALDDELVAAMARAGCVGAEIGTDTGTDAMLARLRKPFSLGDVVAARASFARHGMADCHTFVLGAEGETLDDVRATLAFVEALDPDVAVFIAFMEDRESIGVSCTPQRDGILALLAEEAPKRPGWVVPELSIRFGGKLAKVLARAKRAGPSWLWLARSRRA
jgi:radical SAM superfamily enzyme YgiQ (UPF0313 family)